MHNMDDPPRERYRVLLMLLFECSYVSTDLVERRLVGLASVGFSERVEGVSAGRHGGEGEEERMGRKEFKWERGRLK
jgi:hypothetical protein